MHEKKLITKLAKILYNQHKVLESLASTKSVEDQLTKWTSTWLVNYTGGSVNVQYKVRLNKSQMGYRIDTTFTPGDDKTRSKLETAKSNYEDFLRNKIDESNLLPQQKYWIRIVIF